VTVVSAKFIYLLEGTVYHSGNKLYIQTVKTSCCVCGVSPNSEISHVRFGCKEWEKQRMGDARYLTGVNNSRSSHTL
jgi:hypothetical protein